MELYGLKARFFVYNSSNLHQLDEFSQNSGINVMIINTQAFNTTMNEDKNVEGRSGNETARIIYTKRDEFGSRRPIAAINSELLVARLTYTLTKGEQTGTDFNVESTETKKLDRAQGSFAEYDLIGKIAEGTTLTRRTITAILSGISREKLRLFQQNPEEFITKVAGLINRQKASVVVEHITYTPSAEEPYSQDIFNMSRASDEYAKAFKVKHAIQDYVFTDGTATNSIERRFAEELDTAKEVVVYAKLPRGPRGFYIPTPVGYYSPDWAISFKKGAVKHIFFIAETKGTMDSLELRPIEQAKISCARKLFNEISTSGVKYHDVDSYHSLLEVMETL